MSEHPTITTQEQLLHELLAHEHGMLLGGGETGQEEPVTFAEDEELGSLPYAYALEAVVT